ncbi:unnamed protein product [marine sediment metagenome]|uniref:Uncharacterized protein n=1 Tax=marine sediment metagenome TaxID=412755 RepID=X1E0Z0_9ZZZZ
MFFNKKKEDELDNNFKDKDKTEKIVQQLLEKEGRINKKIITNFFLKVDEAIKK